MERDKPSDQAQSSLPDLPKPPTSEQDPADRDSPSSADASELLKPLKWEPTGTSSRGGDGPATSSAASDLNTPLTPVVDLDEESEPIDTLPAPSSDTGKDLPAPAPPPEDGSLVLPPLLGQKPKSEPKSKASSTPKPDAPGESPELPSLPPSSKTAPKDESLPAVKSKTASPSDRTQKKSRTETPEFVLRAFLGMTGTPACLDVVEHAAKLDGVEECVALRSGEVVKSSVSTDNSRLSELAEGAFEKVSGFVSELGISSADALNLQLEEGTLSFFVHDDACLAVMQNDSGLGPGVTERLTLMSQLLGTIPARSSSKD